jgi:hypothetical protein
MKTKTPTRSRYQTPRKTPKRKPRASNKEQPKKEGKRLRDWAAEDAAQVARGRIDFYIAADMFEAPAKTGGRGRPRTYSQTLIWGALALKQLERKAYRTLEGYVASLASMLGYTGETPDHITLWRRAEATPLPPLPEVEGPRTVVVDSTGIKVFGPGEWRRHKHKNEEYIRRTYIKFHAVRDAQSGEILDWALTSSSGYGSGDSVVGAWMLEQLTKEGVEFAAVAADGAYDSSGFRAAAWRGGGSALIPPQHNARLHGEYEGWQRERNQQILACGSSDEERAAWKDASGYHVRSLAETTFSRHHALFGERIMSRLPKRQRLELAIRVWLMNQNACRSLA